MNEEDVTELDSEMSTETPEPRLGGVLVSANLKRRLSDASLDLQKDTRKRAKAPADEGPSSFCNIHTSDNEGDPPVDGKALSDDLAQELQCGCCSELVYRPVVVSPCQHFFCGRCVSPSWTRSAGINVLPLPV
jgi:E3 ubiquitin-protein ligase CHFR